MSMLDTISIHSLRVEGDASYLLGSIAGGLISIHSLRVEGDDFWIQIDGSAKRFQSTPSVWRETQMALSPLTVLIHFNPLPPCGGRLR